MTGSVSDAPNNGVLLPHPAFNNASLHRPCVGVAGKIVIEGREESIKCYLVLNANSETATRSKRSSFAREVESDADAHLLYIQSVTTVSIALQTQKFRASIVPGWIQFHARANYSVNRDFGV